MEFTRKIKITFIITGLSTGGSEIMLLKLLKKFDKKVITASVISLTTKGQIGPQIERLGIDVFTIQMNRRFPSFIKFFKLIKLLKNLNPDIVNTRLYHADLIGGLAAKFVNIENIIWGVYQSNLSFGANKFKTIMVMRICALFSRFLPKYIFTNSKSAIYSHVVAGYDKKKFILIPNGFDLEEFKPNKKLRFAARQEFGFLERTPVIGFVGRYDPQKNQIGFIDAAIEVKKVFPKVQFIFVGPGVDNSNKKLCNAYASAGLEANVRFLGSRKDIVRLINAFDILVLPSIGESFPNILGEAMSCSVPCVVTDVGDARLIVGDPERVSRPDDMIGFGKKIIELLSLNKKQLSVLGKKSRLRIKNNFEINKIARIFEQKYKAIMKGVDL